jgi:NAD/NADP transhydrogenase beta subunit
VRFWLSESERRPDPAPARADARKAVLVGTVGWLVALAAALLWRTQLDDAGLGWLLWAAVTGVAIGIAGLIVVQLFRRRRMRQEHPAD